MAARLYSYIVARDYGFAPNPFYGYCTLATCKPQIRKNAEIGDWIIGTGSKSKGRNGHIVYAMRVTEAMSFDEYWADSRFQRKRPDMHASVKKAFGDNIYYRDDAAGWRQLDSHHSYGDGTQNNENVRNDTQVNRLLVSNDFIYWGGNGPIIPTFGDVTVCHNTQGHRCNFPTELVNDFETWLRNFDDRGYCGIPLEWE